MDRKNYEGGTLRCVQCGRAYADFYEECPYCAAEKQVKAINKYGIVRSGGELLGGVLLTLALLVGLGFLGTCIFGSGGSAIARPHGGADAAQQTEQVTSTVTQQDVVLSGDGSSAAPEGESASPAGGQEDGQTSAMPSYEERG